MITNDVYLTPVLDNVPRLLGLLNRNISSASYGCFDREYWHYNTVDFACARKQEAVLTLTLLYLIKHEKNRYYRSREILEYIRAALMFWTRIQTKNGSFNEWYPNENSFVGTSFSTYAVSESLLLIKDDLPVSDYKRVMEALMRAGDWLISRHETRVMNQQTGAAITLLNLHLLTNEERYLNSSRDKISLVHQRQSTEGWFLEYGGPDIGYLSLAIDYLSKYYLKTNDDLARKIIDRSLSFIKYFVQPNLIAGGECMSRNTEYLIPHGFEICSKHNDDAILMASVVRKSLLKKDSFPNLFDDRYFTYVGYTWLQAYLDANQELNETVESNIDNYFREPFRKHFEESGLLIINDEDKHFIVNVKKGGAFRLFDKSAGRAYSDSGILVRSENKWFTSGWLSVSKNHISQDVIEVSDNLRKIPDKTLTPLNNILLTLFQTTFGRSSVISLWVKERLRDILITKAKPSSMRYNRALFINAHSNELLRVKDSVNSSDKTVSSIASFVKDTHIFVPSSRYYLDIKDLPYRRNFPKPVGHCEINWKIQKGSGVEFEKDK